LKKGYSIIKKGKKICIITTGKMVSTAKIITEKLSNYQIGIIDLFAVKPLNNDIVKDLLKYKKIFSLEEHNQTGGIGSILSDLIVEKNLDVRLKKLALKENLIFGYGSRDLLQERNSLDITSVIKTIKKNV
jgi:transketolase